MTIRVFIVRRFLVYLPLANRYYFNRYLMSKKSRKTRQGSTQIKPAPAITQPKTVTRPIPRQPVKKPSLLSQDAWYGIILLILTFIAFYPSLKNDFMPTWDDDKYVTNNPYIHELNGSSIGHMFTKQVNGTYVPLPLLTFAIEYKLFGNNPLPHHCTNLLLHLLCTLLVFRIFRMLKINPLYAAFGALLFGIHPMRVESVAWITERKDVLFGFFYLASVVAYVNHRQKENPGSKFIILSYIFFFLALLSKIEAVTLPLSLLLIDYYLERPLKLKLITEKTGYFLLSLLFGILGIVVIYLVGRKVGGFLKANEMVGLTDRIFYAFYAISGYILKFIFPFQQSALYPYPSLAGWEKILFFVLNPLLILSLAYAIYRSARHTRAFVTGSLFFLVNVFFLLQIFAVGVAFFADRFTYIPYIGLAFIAAWSAEWISAHKSSLKNMAISILAIFSIVFMVMTYNRCQVWKNGETLWSDVINQYPENVTAFTNRGVAYTGLGEWDNAIADFTKAISIDKNNTRSYANRGLVYGKIGKPQDAIADFTMAISLDPKNPQAYHNRGVTYGGLGQTEQAIRDFSKAIELDPKYASAYVNLGLMYFLHKDFDKAIGISRQGLGIDPQNAGLLDNIGNCLLEKGDPSSAIVSFQKCLMIDEANLDAMLGLAAAYYLKNNLDYARGYFHQAQGVEQSLGKGMEGLAALERSGFTIGEKKKDILGKMFATVK